MNRVFVLVLADNPIAAAISAHETLLIRLPLGSSPLRKHLMSVIGSGHKRTIPRLSAIGDKADIEDDTFRKEKGAASGCAKVGGVADQFIGTGYRHRVAARRFGA